jgi:hypothetical protein
MGMEQLQRIVQAGCTRVSESRRFHRRDLPIFALS